MAGAVNAVLLAGLLVLVWLLRWVLLMLFAALVGAVALDIPVSYLVRVRHLPRPRAVFLVIMAFLLLLWLLALFVLPEVFFQARELVALGPQIFDATREQGLHRIADVESTLQPYFEMERFALLRSAIQSQLEDPNLYSRVLANLQPATWGVLRGIGAQVTTLARFVLICVLATLLCTSPTEHRQMVVNAAPAFYRDRLSEILDMCREALGGLLLGLCINATGVTLVTWLGLTMLGCPLALFSGCLCGVITFMPAVGPVIAAFFPATLGLAVSESLAWRTLLLGVGVQYVLIPVLKPQIMKYCYVNILPTVALLAQAGFGVLLGLPGAMLSLPAVAVGQVVLREVLLRDVMDNFWKIRQARGATRIRRARTLTAFRRQRSAGSSVTPAPGRIKKAHTIEALAPV